MHGKVFCMQEQYGEVVTFCCGQSRGADFFKL